MARVAEALLSEDEQRLLGRWIELLSEALDLQSVWLYGSRARGEAGPESDVDLLVVAREEKHWEAARTAHDLLMRAADDQGTSFLPYSIHVRDPEYISGRREIRSFFMQEVDRDKVVLYGEP